MPRQTLQTRLNHPDLSASSNAPRQPLTAVGYQLGPYVIGDQLVVGGGENVYAYDAASLTTDRPLLRWQKKYSDPLHFVNYTHSD